MSGSMSTRRAPLLLAAALTLGCSGGEDPPPAGSPAPRPWQRLATPTSALPGARGLRPARGIVHAHSPAGFDLHAEDVGAGGAIVEVGGAAPAGARVVARAPAVLDPDPAVPAPEITMRLLRVTAAGTEVVAEGAEVAVDAAAPGAYRAEVRITPHHLRPYLGPTPNGYIKSYPWVISNPIYVE